jgi:hypothetical protein
MSKEIELLRLPGNMENFIVPAKSDDMTIFIHCSMDSTAIVSEEVFLRTTWPVLQAHGFDSFTIKDVRENDSCYCKL